MKGRKELGTKLNEKYAIIHKGWAYMKPSGKDSKKRLTTVGVSIKEKYQRRPKDMAEELAKSIITNLKNKGHKNIRLAKSEEETRDGY